MTARALPTGATRGRSVPESPEVSVCVLVLADVGRVGGCLDSVRAATELPVETVVVANGTPPGILAGLAARDDIVLVPSPANLGFAGGNDLAAQCSQGSHLVFVNDDSVLAPKAIDQLVARAESDPAIGAVGCRILSTDGSLQEAGVVLWRDGTAALVGRGEPGATGRYTESRDVDFCSANGLLVKRAAWDAVGGFDRGFHPAYYEDVDLCLALREHGYRVVYEPSARLTHAESSSTTAPYKAFLLERHRRRLVDRWSTVLSGLEPPPLAERAAAIARSVARPPAGTVPPGTPADRPTSIGDRRGPADLPADLTGLALESALGELAVRSEYIAELETEVDRLGSDLDRHTRLRRSLRQAETALANLLPVRVKEGLRGRLPGR
jgi:GT2 family glycosyltransferase